MLFQSKKHMCFVWTEILLKSDNLGNYTVLFIYIIILCIEICYYGNLCLNQQIPVIWLFNTLAD